MKKPKMFISYRLKVLLIYFIVSIVPILVLSGVVQTQYVVRLQEQAFETLDRSTESFIKILDDCMVQVKSIANGLILLNETNQDYLPEKPIEANQFRDRLGAYVSSNTLFEEIALYSSNNEYIFSNTSSYTKERECVYIHKKGGAITLLSFFRLHS